MKAKKCRQACETLPCDNCKSQKQKDAKTHAKTHARQTQKVEPEIKSSKQGRVGNIFRIKKLIGGPKKTPQEAAAIKDPKTGELLVSKKDIKRATLEYCVQNLKNNKPNGDLKDQVIMRKRTKIEKMKDRQGETFHVNYDDFEEVLTKLAVKSTRTYDFLLNAGDIY